MKTVAKVIAGLLVLMLVAVGVFLATFDPNDYKARIEQLALEKGNVELNIDGDIGWALFPSLALKLPALTVREPGGEPLASLRQAQVEVALLPLLSSELKVSGLLIDGLELDITKPEPAAATPAPEQGAGAPADAPALLLDVGSVQITNAQIIYRDPAAGQRVELRNFNFRADELVSARSFPARTSFELKVYQGEEAPMLEVESEFDGQLYLDLVRQQFRAEEMDLKLMLKADALEGKTVPVQLQGGLAADLEADRVAVTGLGLSLANLKLNVDLTVTALSGPMVLQGEVTAPPFDLKELLAALGQPPLETQDATVLRELAFSARIEGPADTLGLKDLGLTLDDSNLAGEVRYGLTSGALWLRLKGDRIDLDRYLPPTAESAPAQSSEATTETASAELYSKAPLLPLDALRTLELDAQFRLDEVRVAQIGITNLNLAAVASNGRIEVSQVAGDLYEGNFNNSAVIDARTTPVTLAISKNIQGVQLGGLLQDVLDKDLFSGRFDMNGDYRAKGNSIHAIVNSLDGSMKFDLQEGRLKGINLTDQLCRGILRVQGKTPSPEAAQDYTEFSNVTGSVILDKGVAANRDLRASLVGISLDGDGTVDLPRQMLDYGLNLTVLRELKGPNCQIEKQLHNVALPVRCKGSFDQDPASLCRPDTARMKEVVASLYGEEAKQKVEEVKEKARGKLEEKLKDNSTVQDALKGLFN